MLATWKFEDTEVVGSILCWQMVELKSKASAALYHYPIESYLPTDENHLAGAVSPVPNL